MIRENHLNFTEIAAALQYSTVHHLSRQFKEEVGLSISEYVTQQRLIYAKKLLVKHNIPVKDIAKQAGFNNVSHFVVRSKKLPSKHLQNIARGKIIPVSNFKMV